MLVDVLNFAVVKNLLCKYLIFLTFLNFWFSFGDIYVFLHNYIES